MPYIAILAVSLIFLASLAFVMQLGLKQILRAIFYQIYYYILGSTAMLEDFIYRRANKIAIRKHSGNVAVVTGGARGIGVEIVKHLLQCDMHVILGCRNVDAGRKTIEKIRAMGIKSGNSEIIPLDLISLKSVRLFADKVLQKHQRLHLLINNAGVMFVPFNLTEDNVESHFAVNYLGHCLLTHLLLPRLKAGGEARGKNSRVVNVSSCAYLAGRINFKDLTMRKGYIAQAAYAQSKLAQIFFTNKLEKLLRSSETPVQAHSVHPGLVNTDLFNGTLMKTVFPFVPYLCFKTPTQGAASILHAALAEDLENIGGNYISNCRAAALRPPATDQVAQDKLWDIMGKLISAPRFGGI